MNYAAQKSALTRAVNTGDPERVEDACRKVVAEWNTPGNYWPDDWARWQRALDDVLPWNQHISLDDLADERTKRLSDLDGRGYLEPGS